MTNEQIETIRKIKRSIIRSSAVVDTVFVDGTDETVCEALDGLLAALGVDDESLDEDYKQ